MMQAHKIYDALNDVRESVPFFFSSDFLEDIFVDLN